MNNVQPQYTKQKNQKEPVFEFSYWPVITDYALRWAVFEALRYRFIVEWLFWLCQVIIIPLIIILWISPRNEIARKKYSIPGTANVEVTAWEGIFCLLLVLSGVIITYSLHKEWTSWIRWGSSIIVFMVYGFYILGVTATVFKPTSKEDLRKEKEKIEASLTDDERDIIDANDIRIVRMETEIFSISQRVDSYTLESALFGALAFSGFLTLISSDKPTLLDIQNLVANLSAIFSNLSQLGLRGFAEGVIDNITESNLIAAVTIETLICSMLFVSVVVSRLRFYGTLRKVDYAVKVARTYNNKEEEVFNIKLQMRETERQYLNHRLENLTKKVNDAINHAEPLFRDLLFIANYMWGFRNLGIGSFVLILITSAFLISKVIGLLFISLFILAYIYTTFDKWWRDRRIRDVPFFLAFEKKIFRISRTDR